MFVNEIGVQEEILIGFVHEIEEKGWVKGIAICTGDEDFEVESNEWYEKLSKEIDNDVRVTGVVHRVADGKNRILVSGYEMLHAEDDYMSNYKLDGDET